MRTTRKDIVKATLLLFCATLAVLMLLAVAGRVRSAYGADDATFRHSTAFYRYQWLEGRKRKAELRSTTKALRQKLNQAQRQLKVRWQPDVRRAIALAAIVYRQDGGDMLRVANCETGGTLSPYAKNRRSSASGLYQFLYPSTWSSTPFARFSVWDPYVSALAAGWMWANGRRGEWVCQ